jgi:hypothetical protein
VSAAWRACGGTTRCLYSKEKMVVVLSVLYSTVLGPVYAVSFEINKWCGILYEHTVYLEHPACLFFVSLLLFLVCGLVVCGGWGMGLLFHVQCTVKANCFKAIKQLSKLSNLLYSAGAELFEKKYQSVHVFS